MHIQALSEHSDTARLAWEIVQRNDLIPENCFDRVQSLLEQLQEYDLEHKHRASSQHDLAKERRRRRKREKEQEAEQARKEAEEKQRREASVSLDALPDYMEQLYEDSLDAKVEATGKILALAQKVGNLEALVTNDALVNGLARTLKEDYKKKMDLCLNIMGVFLRCGAAAAAPCRSAPVPHPPYSFSHFSQMHEVVVGANIGDMALRIMDLELRRHDMRLQVCPSLSPPPHSSAPRRSCAPRCATRPAGAPNHARRVPGSAAGGGPYAGAGRERRGQRRGRARRGQRQGESALGQAVVEDHAVCPLGGRPGPATRPGHDPPLTPSQHGRQHH